MRQNHKHHIYNAYNNFGHWNVANNMDPLLVAENVPKWSTSSNKYFGCFFLEKFSLSRKIYISTTHRSIAFAKNLHLCYCLLD